MILTFFMLIPETIQPQNCFPWKLQTLMKTKDVVSRIWKTRQFAYLRSPSKDLLPGYAIGAIQGYKVSY